MNKSFPTIIVLLFGIVATVTGQTIKATGVVRSQSDGQPLPGATIIETGTSKCVITDINGQFNIDVDANSTITVSFVGFENQTLQPSANMDIVLVDDIVLDDIVVTGYQVQRKADLTGSVGVMDMKQALSEGTANMLNSLQGRIAGVNVVTDPAPGGSGSTIQVRGMSNFNGNNAPLYIIDGVATNENLSSLNLADIESMQVLKDASSASIYGSRAANGVVVITTKSGRGDKQKINISYTASMQTIANTFDLLNANEWGTAYYRAKSYSNQSAYNAWFTYDTDGNAYLNQNVGEYQLHDTDWQDAVYRTALTHNINASISNSTEKGTALLSGNYINQEGIMEESKYERFSARVNTTYDFGKYVGVGENLMLSKWRSNIGATGSDSGIPFNAMRQFPGMPVRQADGSFSSPLQILGSDILNPVHELYNSRDNENESWRIFGNAYLEIKPISELAIKTNIGIDHVQFDNTTYTRKIAQSDEASLSRAYGKGDTWTWTNTANYTKTWANNTLTALLGSEAISYKYDGFSAWRNQYTFEDKNYMTLGTGEGTQTNDGNKTSWGLFSIFGKIDYNYADRYLASVTMRRDQSSRLGATNNDGIFPAVSFAWRLTEEGFWTENNILNDLKLRVAWGQNGNSEIGNYATYSMYAFNKGNAAYDLYGTGSTTVAGVVLASSGNTNIKWETTSQTNIGVDAQLFDRTFGLTADFFIKKTTDMLTQPPVLSVAGENAVMWQNTGDMQNIGFELNLNYRSKEYGDFSWEATTNLSHFKNKIIKLNNQQNSIGGDIRLMKDQPMGVYYGYVADGLFQNQTEVYNHATQQGAAPGRIKYRDLNADGVINEADRCIIGDPNTDLSASLNLDFHYKQWTLSLFFNSDLGFDIYNATKKQLEFFSYGNATTNRGKCTLDAWTPTNTNASIPALSVTDDNNEMRMSTYYIEDGSYLKMKYAKIAYQLPLNYCQKIHASSLSIYGQVENIFTITNYSGLDPEIAFGTYGSRTDNAPYPRSRTFSIGINVAF
ncbi:MAG: TonB-dependent receptor [Marinilabiliaceae bacterium]|nr:TonB-dependent receptor [Marinilabiliaceae bacterium]